MNKVTTFFQSIKNKVSAKVPSFHNLSVRTKKTTGIIVTVFLVLALPVFIWGVVTQRFNFLFRAASGEPSGEPPAPTFTPIAVDKKAVLYPIADTYIKGSEVNSNQSSSTDLPVGELNSSKGAVRRSLIKFDLTSIPKDAVITSAMISLYRKVDYANKSSVFNVYRLKQPWVEKQVTWKIWKKGSNWASPGAFGATDTEQIVIGNRIMAANEAKGYKDFMLSPGRIQEMVNGTFANNGFLFKADSELDNGYTFASSANGTNSRPVMTVAYKIFVRPTATPTPKGIPTPTAIPNTCNANCIGNADCMAGYYCYAGLCRNPVCANDSTCRCDTSSFTPTPTATPVQTPKISFVVMVEIPIIS